MCHISIRYAFEQLHYFRKLAAQAKAEKIGIWLILYRTNLYQLRNDSIAYFPTFT
jgi:hypothetical protein